MAAEAVLKIKEAEEKGSERVKNASERAKEVIRTAESSAALKKNEIIGEAGKRRTEIIGAALEKAAAECGELSKIGNAEKEKILNPSSDAFGSAVEYAVEKILKAEG